MTSLVTAERARLSDLLAEVGPDAPTLCAGWTARDLAAHLVVRETRPDAAAGIVLKPLAAHGESVRADYAQRRAWDLLVRDVRSGPPVWSPMAWPLVEPAVNTVELFVHHEDVRRAQPGWTARSLDPGEQDELWSHLRRVAALHYRRSPVGVMLRRADGGELRVRSVSGRGTVSVTGEPAELLLHAFGRRGQALVAVDGDPADVEAFHAAGF